MGRPTQAFRMSDGSIVTVEHHDTLPSVLNLARERAKAGCPDRYVVFAEAQRLPAKKAKGRERHYQKGIYCSLILRPSLFVSQAGLLGALSAVALHDALSDRTEKPLGIGWVSDIYCDRRKIGGVSIEGKLDAYAAYEYLILSFFLTPRSDDFPPKLSDMVQKVFEEQIPSLSLLLIRHVLNSFFTLYPYLKTPPKFMELYRDQFALRGKRVRYTDKEGRVHHVKVLGVEPKDGSLMLEMKNGLIEYVSKPSSIVTPKRI